MNNLNRLIDHTLLKPDATSAQVQTLIDEAKAHNFASVMVNSSFVSQCAQQLAETEVKVATVIGFPLGAVDTKTKCDEVKNALANGANEFDMVINIGRLKQGDLDYVTNEIKALRELTKGYILKVIIETCLLTDEEKIKACKCVSDAKADFIKTSTGFSTGGATVEDVALLRKHVDKAVQVKASGGVRNYEQLQAMVQAGATRIGTSSGVALMNKIESNSAY